MIRFFSSKKQVDDLQFMNEVDAALRSRGGNLAYILSGTVSLIVLVFFIWANNADLDEVTRGEGQVIASQRTQLIQNLEGGILSEILVTEGQIVERGELLARIDNEAAASTYRDAASKVVEHEAAIIRLEAEYAGTSPEFSEEFKRKAPQAVSDQMAAFTTRQAQNRSEEQVLRSQITQRSEEVKELQSRKTQLEESLQIAIQQREIARPLLEKKIYSTTDFLNLEQRVVQLRGDINGLAANLAKTQASVRELEEKLSLRRAELESEMIQEMNKRRLELSSLREALSAGGDRVTRTDVRSPVKGTVKQIMINTIGGVIRPGENIMEVVPLDDTLLIEARIRPSDIAFLRPKQEAIVKVSAYDFSVYGGLDAVLEQISADTIEDKKGEVHYLVKLRTKTNSLFHRGVELPIIPGMTATVDILTGKKSVLAYLLKPILKAKQSALRER